MFHYLFTNDLRISELETSIIEAARCLGSASVPTAIENKSANNNIKTLGFYFNLENKSNCAKAAEEGEIRKVVLNFMKKFQFPNMRTAKSYKDAIDDKICLAPMRTIIKLLFTMLMSEGNNAYLERKEIKEFIFYNREVAKKKNPDIIKLYMNIKEYRQTKALPNYIETDPKKIFWPQEDRQIREMIKILKWSGFIEEDRKGKIWIKNNELKESDKAEIFEIISENEYWEGDNKESYQQYMDIKEGKRELGMNSNLNIGENIIYYGAPGTGKSHDLDQKSKDFDFIERVTFYPEYSHDDFIGCFMPCMSYIKNDTTEYMSMDGMEANIPGKPIPYYTFVPGPFTNALINAFNNTDKNVLLVVEELNRANAAAVFGEVFQLLDRTNTGESKYSISISNEYSEYLASKIFTYSKGEKVKVPNNLTICATMNSADQGVNPLDSAFKRRWNFKYVPIDFTKATHKDYQIDYANNKVTWESFAKTINNKLKEKDINEDKHLGQYFITETEIRDGYKFASKILLYLFDDVLKFNRRGFFKNYKTFSDLLTDFNGGKEVFDFSFEYVVQDIPSIEVDNKLPLDTEVSDIVAENSRVIYNEKIEVQEASRIAEDSSNGF